MFVKALILALTGSLLSVGPANAVEVEFIFSGEGVKALGQKTAQLKVGETVKFFELTERFSGYQTTLSNECEGFCIIIKKGAHSISVFYDQDERTISRISGWCSEGGGIIDQSGAQCGDPIAAVSNMQCDSGESETCASKALAGLSYIVNDGKVAGFEVYQSPDASANITAKCLLEVGGKRYIDAPCKLTMERDGSFTFDTFSTTGFFAVIMVTGEKTAVGAWNGEEKASHAHESLGDLKLKNGCWRNSTARVCAWK